MNRELVGTRLREARRMSGLTLRATADALAVSAGTWSAIENGRTRITADRVEAAARLFGVEVEILTAPHEPPGVLAPELTWRDFPPLELAPPLAGALSAFVELGYHGSTIRDIAQRANLSVPGLYHHWPTKQHLLVALLDLTMDELVRRTESARAEGDGPVERFKLLIECLALFHTHRRELGFIGASEMRSLDEPDRSRIAALRIGIQRMVDAEVREAKRRGSIGTPLPHEAARAVVTMCTALPSWWSPTGPSTPSDVAAQYVDFGLDLVRFPR
ncbi:helix-turn-helix domain-containing protein [Cryptosporangium sp. NPDC051539]|uniref:helix-turn-helix domain-containing protein n=1 Tax=Cryptosporangium sp. NPDC051539 TaxID=3363962 RepID=UPI00378BF115